MRQLCILAQTYEDDYDSWMAPNCCTNTHYARLGEGTGYLGPRCSYPSTHRVQGSAGYGPVNKCPGGTGRKQARDDSASWMCGSIVYAGVGRQPDPNHQEDYWNYCGVYGGGSADAGKCTNLASYPKHHSTLHTLTRSTMIPASWQGRFVLFYDITTARAYNDNCNNQAISYWRANHQRGATMPAGSNIGRRDGSVTWRNIDPNVQWGWNWTNYGASGNWQNYEGFFFNMANNAWTVIPSETVSYATNMSYYWNVVPGGNSHMYSDTYINTPWLNR